MEQARQSNTIKQIKLIGFNFWKFKNKSWKENVKTKFLFLKNWKIINIRPHICSLYEAVSSIHYNLWVSQWESRSESLSWLDVLLNYLLSSRPPPGWWETEQTVNTEIISTSNTSHLSHLPLSTAAQCETIAGDQCLFPFTYQGTTYYSCTVEDSDNGSPWCAVQVRSGPRRTVMPGKWDDCSPGGNE